MTIYSLRIVYVIIISAVASLQALPYTITGRVVSGKTPVTGISVRVTDTDDRGSRTTSTDSSGAFVIEDCVGGKVVIAVEGDGYASLILGVATGNEDTDLGTLEVERVTDLEEVTVSARSRIDVPGKTTVYASKTEKERATGPFNMLTILSYKAPQIKVRESERTIMIDGEEPQILVNGIKRPMSYISSIKPDAIKKVEFSSEPDVRFGKRYLNIVTLRTPEGGWVMADVAGALTTPRNHFSGVADYARGKNEFMLYYDGGYRHGRREYSDETERYIGGGKDIILGAEGRPSSTLDKYHTLYFNFTRVPSEKSMIVATATIGLHDNDRESYAYVTELSRTYDRSNLRGYSQKTPALSLYYSLQTSKNTTIEINASGTYNDFSSYRDLSYSTGYDSRLTASSSSWHYSAEALWTQRLSFARLNAGVSYSRSDVSNRYDIDGKATCLPLSNTYFKAYSSIGGNVLSIGYRLSAGLTYYKAKEGMTSPDLMASLQKGFGNGLSLSYFFRYNPGMPSLSDYNNVPTPVNELMYHIGSDHVVREKNMVNRLQAQYSRDLFFLSLRANADITSDPIVTDYLYQDDPNGKFYGFFLEMPGNGRRLTRYGFDIDTGVSNLWEFLSLSVSTGWGHSRLKAADTFTACSWKLGANLGLYWKGWQLNIAADGLIPSRSIWKSTVSKSWPYTSLSVYRKVKNWNFHATWSNCFRQYGGRYRTETISPVVRRTSEFRMNDQGNLIEIGVRYQFSSGKLLNKKERSINLKGNGENGVQWDY